MQAAPVGTTTSIAIRHDRTMVGTARHAVAAQLRRSGVSPDFVDDAVLVVSELVTNAIRHAHPLPSGDICVRWRLEPEYVHLEIVDGGSPTRPQAGTPTVTAGGGRGLDIVRQVSARWGVDEGPSTQTVWADVPLTRASHPKRSH